MKRYVADVDLQSAEPWLPTCKPSQKKRVAIVGAGPAGLAAAYYLLQQGFACTMLDEHDKPGGMLRYGVPENELPRDVLDAEIAVIEKLGAQFETSTRIGTAPSIETVRKDFDAVFVAVGRLNPGDADWLGLQTGPNGITVKGKTYQTSLSGVFAGGDAVRNRRLAVRAVADGKEAAAAIGQYLFGQTVTGSAEPFNTHIGRLKEGEIERFLTIASDAHRLHPLQKGAGYTDQRPREEAARCLHCDCRKPHECKLRQYAADYNARPRRYKADRRTFEQHLQHPDIIFELGKCIDCGLCIQIAAKAGEDLGLTFIGRGFDVRVAVPFDRSIAEGLKQAGAECVAACPTGALAFKKKM